MDSEGMPGDEVSGGEGALPGAEVVGLRAELDEVRRSLAVAHDERDAALGAAESRGAEAQAAVLAAEEARADAETRASSAYRRAVLAELQGEVIPELIAGNTVEEIDASVAGARAAFARAVDVARQQIRAEQDQALALVPPGVSTRDRVIDEGLSPLDRISRALLNSKA